MNDLQIVVTAKVIFGQNDVVAEQQLKVGLPRLDKSDEFSFETGLVGLGEAQVMVGEAAKQACQLAVWKGHRVLGLELNKMVADRQQAEEGARDAVEAVSGADQAAAGVGQNSLAELTQGGQGVPAAGQVGDGLV